MKYLLIEIFYFKNVDVLNPHFVHHGNLMSYFILIQ